MKNKKGFTLIELLAVIIILGILMIIAIPSVTRYISDSRKNAYIDTAKEIIAGARNLVNEGKLEMYDTNTTYYIPSNCIKTENASKSPYGEFIKDKTYVVVTYDGKGYSYYWVSLDDAGEGVSELKSIDELDTDDIKSDLTRDDIRDDIGVGGREKVTIFNETCTGKIDKDAYKDVVCKRATTLHTVTCSRTYSGCYKVGYYVGGSKNTSTITYGNLGLKGSLNPGDAFDCDVNGDGEFNSENERFYYISKTGNNSDSIVSLIYYNNVYNGYSSVGNRNEFYSSKAAATNLGYSCEKSNGCSNYGPILAYKHLPSTTQWSNPKLIVNQTRSITNEEGGKITNNSENIIDEFTYQDKAARLLTTQELTIACNFGTFEFNKKLYDCEYIMENTCFEVESGRSEDIWLENPVKESHSVWEISSTGYGVTRASLNNTYGVRPVIDIKLSNIEY